MIVPFRRIVSIAVLLVPLAGVVVLHGCDSPTAPKYPDPIEDEDTVTNEDEGATGRRWLGSRPVPAREIMRAIEAHRCAATAGCR